MQRTANIKYWLALHFIDDLGSVGIKNLVALCGSPRAVFDATDKDLLKVPRLTRKAMWGIRNFSDWRRVDKELEYAERFNARIVTSNDNEYPQLLRNIYDFPPLLYVKGQLSPNDINIAVIGSRAASAYGRFMTERLCRDLVWHGITVVSGMARGVDSAAHRGALGGKGRTIAVLGSGIDVVYPPENRKLCEEIAAHGAVITEYPFGTEPRGPHFPQRNRIISGLSLGVVVVEASMKSGSLITARLALEQGKEVFAIPGNIDSPGSKGTHKLLKEGAKLVESIDDILEEIAPQIDISCRMSAPESSGSSNGNPIREHATPDARHTPPSVSDEELVVLKLLGTQPIYIDNLIRTSGYHPNRMLSILLSLELKGYIQQLPGKRFISKE